MHMTSQRITLVLLGLLLLVGCSSGPATPTASPTDMPVSLSDQLHGAVIDPPRALTDFTLASTSGDDFTLSDHRGQLILLYFGYRTCPDFCPTTFTELRQAYLDLNAPADDVKIVFVSVDPERDDIDGMTRYVHGFHDDFIGLRAEGETLQSVMDQFGVVAERRQLGDSALSYLIDHTASIFLINADGQLAAQYLYGTPYQDIRDDLRLILQSQS
jgi:protein SCO1/2